MRALPWALACALSSLLYALPSYAQEPAPVSSDAGAPDAAAGSVPMAAPSQPGPPVTPDAGPAPGTPVAGPAPGTPDAGPAPATPFAGPAPATPVAEPAPGSETAASAAPNQSGEIEVTTSRKRVEAVQETPVAVSVVGPRQLNGAEGAKIHNLDDLSGTVPSFTIDAQQTSAGWSLCRSGASVSRMSKSHLICPSASSSTASTSPRTPGSIFRTSTCNRSKCCGPQGTLFGGRGGEDRLAEHWRKGGGEGGDEILLIGRGGNGAGGGRVGGRSGGGG